MDEELVTRAPGFQKGHVKYGGRTRKSTTRAREIAERLGVDPLEYLVKMLATGTYEAMEIGPRGGETRVKKPVPLEMLVDVAKCVAQYVHPRLSCTQVSGNADAPIAVETSLSLTSILANPALAAAAQELAFAVATAEAQPLSEHHPLMIDTNSVTSSR